MFVAVSLRHCFPARSAIRAHCKSRLSTMAYEQELQVAIQAVTLACRLCQSVQKKLVANESQAKSDKSPVTVADYGSQALVSWALRKQLREPFSMVAEEDSEDLRNQDGLLMLNRVTELVNEALLATGHYIDPLSSQEVLLAIDQGRSNGGSIGRHWILDPIDGTKGFMRGKQYAVALALLDEGDVVVGVLGCPNLPLSSIGSELPHKEPIGCLFAAKKGGGTMMHSLDGSMKPQKVHVNNLEDPSRAVFCESYESAHSLQELTGEIASILGVKVPPIRIDSQAKYAAMARGDAAIYLRFPHSGYREKVWDHAAGFIVITEAGGQVIDANGKCLDFSTGRFLDIEKGIIATNPRMMPAVLAATKQALRHHH